MTRSLLSNASASGAEPPPACAAHEVDAQPTPDADTATAPLGATADAPLGIPGRPGTRAECDVIATRLAMISARLRGEVQAGMAPERYAVARTCVAALDAAQSLIAAIRLTLGPDAAHAPGPPKR